jgi:glycerol-1-phosphate dehydrogenase [NAD(P)+]
MGQHPLGGKGKFVKTELPIYTEQNAIPSLIRYCESNGLDQFMLVADQNTYAALGKAVEEALTSRGFDVKTVVLTGEEIVTNEHYVVRVLVHADREDRVYLAVGSGTITDIVRFSSHRTKASFISLPTAASVDGFTSVGAPMVIGGLKQTVYAHPPIAIFADLNTLCAAPRPMIAAGFGDIVGKYTALADWKLGRLLWDEPYSDEIVQRVWDALQNCVDRVEEIGSASAEGIRSLMDGLAESGLCMVDFGNSRPASGAEHYLSHYWEMKLLQENRPAILHGAKVGVGCILVAKFYDKVKGLTREQATETLKTATMPDREGEIQRIREVFGPIADTLVAEQAPFLDMTEEAYGLLKQKIIDRWDEVQDIAATVPASQELVDLLRKVDGPVDTKTLGLNDEEVALGLKYSHYVRNRFTVIKLCHILGVSPFQ